MPSIYVGIQRDILRFKNQLKETADAKNYKYFKYDKAIKSRWRQKEINDSG